MEVRPATGTFTQVEFPVRPYSRVLSIAEEGIEITPFYDNLVAQVVVHGDTRIQAVERMQAFLDECSIQGVETNLPLLRELVASDAFKSGAFSTSFVEEWASQISDSSTLSSDTKGSLNDGLSLVELDGDTYLLKLPSTGIVWAAPTPSSPAFVKTGDVLRGDQTLVLLEVMKMFMPVKLNQLFPDMGENASYFVYDSRDVDGQYMQKGEIFMQLKKVQTGTNH